MKFAILFHVKTYLHLLLLALLVGCATRPSPQFSRTVEQYRQVNRSTSRDEVYRLIGPPQSTTSDGRQKWSVSDRGYNAELLLRFEPDGRITEMEQHYPLQ